MKKIQLTSSISDAMVERIRSFMPSELVHGNINEFHVRTKHLCPQLDSKV